MINFGDTFTDGIKTVILWGNKGKFFRGKQRKFEMCSLLPEDTKYVDNCFIYAYTQNFNEMIFVKDGTFVGFITHEALAFHKTPFKIMDACGNTLNIQDFKDLMLFKQDVISTIKRIDSFKLKEESDHTNADLEYLMFKTETLKKELKEFKNKWVKN